MKFLISLLAIVLLSFVAGLYLPWWSVAVVAFGVALTMPQRSWKIFLAGFFGVFLLWIGLTWWIDRANGGILSSKMAIILPVGGNVIYLHLLTAFVGGLVGGLASLSGGYVRALFSTEKN